MRPLEEEGAIGFSSLVIFFLFPGALLLCLSFVKSEVLNKCPRFGSYMGLGWVFKPIAFFYKRFWEHFLFNPNFIILT